MNIFNIIGTLSTIIVGLWSLVQLYNFFVKPKQELRFFYNEICAFNRDSKIYYKSSTEDIFNSLLSPEIFQIKNKEKNIEELYVYEFGIINTGNKPISSNEFYPAAKLGLNLNSHTIIVSISNKTPKYINAKISKFNKEFAIIDFDSIEPKDCIYVSILSLGKLNLKEVISGQANSIKKIKAFDTKTARECYSSLSYWENQRLQIKEALKQIIETNLFWNILYIILMIFILTVSILPSARR